MTAVKVNLKIAKALVVILSVIAFSTYWASFYVMPSVRVVNHTNEPILMMKVALPSSSLNFGQLMPKQSNEVHYNLSQNDGVYRYRVLFENDVEYTGECGYVTSSEINKRTTLNITNDSVVCTFQY